MANGNIPEEIMEQTIRKAAMSAAEKRAEESVPNVSATNTIKDTNKRRNLLVVGCGDGGSMIASEIRISIPETYCICYNTSPHAMAKIQADIKIVPEAEDGSGKVRDYSKDVFKQGSYKHLLGNVTAALDSHPNIEYVIVVTTTDGGTGSGVSPMVAKFIATNVDIPVIIIGVYPALSEDATAQFNAMSWQTEVEKTGLPYMVFDNSISGTPKPVVHRLINKEIATMLKVITGDFYGETNISQIDSRDLYMLLQHTGKRIFIETDTSRPSTGELLDEYVIDMINTAYQPAPSNAKGIGVFLKGPKNMLDTLDTSIPKVRQRYGDAAVQYSHIEESDSIQISIVMTGCSEPSDRLFMMRSRYDDIIAAQNTDQSTLGSLMDGMNNPLGNLKKTHRDNAEPDLSALDL